MPKTDIAIETHLKKCWRDELNSVQHLGWKRQDKEDWKDMEEAFAQQGTERADKKENNISIKQSHRMQYNYFLQNII